MTNLDLASRRDSCDSTLGPECISREPLLAPKLVRLNAHDAVARARRAESQRRQAAALKAWNRSGKPEWLDQKFYREQIQPRLQTVQVPTIQTALSVSGPYALRIRGGEGIPRQRHWLVLARIAGIQLDK